MTPKSLQSRLKIAKNAKFGSTETRGLPHMKGGAEGIYLQLQQKSGTKNDHKG
ncbi:hypothetical protein KFU94_31975 [Chloroflexi bacterium TSY]|nr:hypothetical protein [Chloroflexi bacterium TSY]